jgi:tRNA-2-methylthio-N6-dimethylallyladenosine synthase
MREPLLLQIPSSTAAVPPAGDTAVGSYHVWTIGCQMNKADSERLESAFDQLGLRAVASPAEADIVVLNSCVVRQSAEDKVVGNLGLMKSLKSKPGRILALMGCMVGPRTEDLRRRFPYVDLFLRPQEFGPLVDLVAERLGVDAEGCVGPLVPARPGITAYIPIIHGCDLFCSFCVIPYRRGRQASRPVPEIVREAELLSARGVREVTLLGQTVDAYGHDLPGDEDLADLLHALHDLPDLRRIRFLTSHPAFMTDRIIRAIAELDKVCEKIDLPIQAGDDDVLAAMRRTYTRDEYLRLIDRVRAAIPDVSLSTDVIVGFCGETEQQFQGTLDLLETVGFDKVHVAAYSSREGTIAHRKQEDTVPLAEKRERVRRVEALQERIASDINARLLGRTLPVLVDGRERGKWKGRTRTDKLVFFEDGAADYHGRMVDLRVTRTGPWSLSGVPAGHQGEGA